LGSTSDPQSASGLSNSSSSTIIDHALLQLEEKLAAVAKAITAIEESLEPILRAVKTPTQATTPEGTEDVIILRKHAAMMNEWESVQAEASVLRDELKEDKWLVVFRNASEQADGMMNSLEKALTHCQVMPDKCPFTEMASYLFALGLHMASSSRCPLGEQSITYILRSRVWHSATC
jgi:hypothetical protein